MLCSAENDQDSLEKKHLPDSLIIIYGYQTLDLDLMDNSEQLSKSTYMLIKVIVRKAEEINGVV